MEKVRKNPILFLLTVFAVIAVSLIIWTTISTGGFRLVRSTPGTSGKIATSTSTIRLDFNRDIGTEVSLAMIQGSERNIVTNIRKEARAIFLSLGTLEEEGKYSFSLGPIQSTSDETISSINFSFKAEYIPYDQLSAAQKELELAITDAGNFDDPILKHLPHQGKNFYLEAELTESDEEEPILVIQAQLFLSRADVGKPRTQLISEFRPSIDEYIKSKQLDPASYLFRYSYNEPPTTQ